MTSGEVFLSTDQIEPALRDEYWRQIMRPIMEATAVDGPGDARLAGTLVSRMCGDMLLWRASVNAQHYRRDRRTIPQSGLDQYWVQLVQSGVHAGDFNGVDARARAGDIYVIDLGQPMSSQVDAGTSVAVVMPRAGLDRASGGQNLHGALLNAGKGLTPLLADYLVGVHRAAARVSARQARVVQDALAALLVAALLVAALSDAPRPAGGKTASQSDALRRRLVHYIAEHLTERELGPESLIARFRISRAHLYRVFEADGGVARFIRERRLDLAYRALADAPGNGESIKAVALRHGSSSGDRLVQAMRRRFGVSVREIMAEAGRLEAAGGGPARLPDHFAQLAGAVEAGGGLNIGPR